MGVLQWYIHNAKRLERIGRRALDGVPGVQDRTKYGVSRAATHSHFTHHLRRISLAAVTGTVQPLARWAKSTLSRILIRATPNPSNLAGEFLSTMSRTGA